MFIRHETLEKNAFLFLLFTRFLPMIPMNEIRMMLPQTKVTRHGGDAETAVEETS